MMLTKSEGRPAIPRDGRHCDLCGCSQPAVRCDKCGCQIFCLSCDDMYHRHPKRRFHLRKAVDTTPATPGARPVLPAKGATLGGDPSKMPLPPPRKKKPAKASFFDNFRRRSPSGENSPPLPKKEYSWTDRFGNIKKFMSNRPLPPLPNSNGAEEAESPPQNDAPSTKHDLSFIHKKVDEKPPQLPQRSTKPNEFARGPHGKENHSNPTPTNGVRDVRNGTLNPSQMGRNNGFGEEGPWNNNRSTEHHNQNTLMRQSGYMYPGSPAYPGNMSASATDLHSPPDFPPGALPHQYPHYPPMPYPHYPMYPQYPPGGYPGGYFGSSFANLSGQQTTTTDHSDHSDGAANASSRHGKKYQFRKRAKRSQSVLVDRMGYPGQFFPFGPYPPGYGPWGGAVEQPPPSPSGSMRSLHRVGGRTRRSNRRTTSEDEEISSSPLSRPKSSSSSGRQGRRKEPAPVVSSSSEGEDEYELAQRGERVSRRDSDPKKMSSPMTRSPQVHQKKTFSKQKKSETLRGADAEEVQQSIAKIDRPSSSALKESNAGQSGQEPALSPAAPWTPSSQWECLHCTYINPAGNRICQVCCKTATVESAGPPPADGNRPSSGTRQSSDEISCSSPEKRIEDEEDGDSKRNKRDMAVLNSALDEAEKEISRGLEELMKLKEDFSPNRPSPSPKNNPLSKPPTTPPPSQQSRPVYKSSGKMRNASILNKLTMPTTKSASTETQTGQTSTTDHVIEARRGSTSSTTSDAYNSPIAQSPILERTSPAQGNNTIPDRGSHGAVSKGPRSKDTSIQTQTDDFVSSNDEGYFGRPNNGYGYRYGDIRMDSVTSPVPSVYDRGYHHPVMQRSHSRASLFTGRMNDLSPLDYGLGPSPMYRSVSRSSLTGDYPENSFAEFHNLRKPAYYLSMEELVERRRQDSIRAQGLELVRMIREAEQQGFTADDIQVALHNSAPNQTPVEWLQQNWRQLAEQVIALSANYANEKRENDVGVVSDVEAIEALRLHKGNVWPAVTECVESRQRKYLELKARGKFSSKDITEALSANQGDVELAYAKLTKSSSKPFLMRIWGAGEGAQNQDGAIPPKATPKDMQDVYFKERDDIQSEGTWDDDEVEWDEEYDEEDEEELGDLEDLQTCHEDMTVKTPDSDRSDYCDAFGSNTLERNMSQPSNETENKLVRRGSFLSKLAGLKRSDKDSRRSSQVDFESLESSKVPKDNVSQESGSSSSDQSKSYNPISVIKNTISAIRDTVNGSKIEKKLPCSAPERRTIIVKGQVPQEPPNVASADGGGVRLTSIKGSLIEDESRLNETFGESQKVPEETKKGENVTMKNVNVNKKPATISEILNKNVESTSFDKVESPSLRSEQSDVILSQGQSSSEFLKTNAKKETSESKDSKYGPISDNKVLTSKCKENLSLQSKTDKLPFKNNLEYNKSESKSVEKIQENAKELATKENISKHFPEPSTNEEAQPLHELNGEQIEKTKNDLSNKSIEHMRTFINERTFKESSSPSTSYTLPEKIKKIPSENKTKSEISHSNAQNISSVEISERNDSPTSLNANQSKLEVENTTLVPNLKTKDTVFLQSNNDRDKISNEEVVSNSSTSISNNKSELSKTRADASERETFSDTEATYTKASISDVTSERNDFQTINLLTDIQSSTAEAKFDSSMRLENQTEILSDSPSVSNATILEIRGKSGEAIKTSSTESNNLSGTSENSPESELKLSSSEDIRESLIFSNILNQNAPESKTNEMIHGTIHGKAVSDSLAGVDTSLIDEVNISADISNKNVSENDSATFQSMAPIHSTTFKRSISNQSTEGKLENLSETTSIEAIQGQTSSAAISKTVYTTETLNSEVASVIEVTPDKTKVTNADVSSDSTITEEQGFVVVDEKTAKDMQEVSPTPITTKNEPSLKVEDSITQFEEASQAKLPTSSNSSTEKENRDAVEANTQSVQEKMSPTLKIVTQAEIVYDSVSEPASRPKHKDPNETGLAENHMSHSKITIQNANIAGSSSKTSNSTSSKQDSYIPKTNHNLAVSLESGISISDPETITISTSVPVTSSSSAHVPVTSAPNASSDTSLSTTTTFTDSAQVDSLPVSSPPALPAPFTHASISSASFTSTNVVSAQFTSAPIAPASIASTPVISTRFTSDSIASSPIAPIPVVSDPIASAPMASTPMASTPTASAPITSAPVASVSKTTVSTPISSVPDASDLFTSAPLTDTFTSASDTSVSATSVSSIPIHTSSSPVATSVSSVPISTSSTPVATSVSATSVPSVPIPTSSSPVATSVSATSVPSISIHTSSTPSVSATSVPITTPSSPVAAAHPAPVASSPVHETAADPTQSDEDSEPLTPPSPVDALRHRFEGLIEDGSVVGPIRPASPFRRMSFRSRKEAIALERTRESSAEKPWFLPKPKVVETKKPLPKRSLKQQMETERRVRQLVADRKVRTYRKAEIVVQLLDSNFGEEEAIQAATECSSFELALSYLQQECLLCTGYFPVSHIISMVHCPHKACRNCIRAYFTVQIRDRNIMELLCPFCNEPDISDEDIAQDYFNHLDMMLKKLVDPEIHELFQRKLRDRVLMRDPSFRWCSKCSSGFLAMENLTRLVCPDCNAVTCASCRRPWEREHQGLSCAAFAALKDGNDFEAQAVSLAKLLTEDGIDCPRCHFRYALAKGGCMHFRCIQCQHDFCSGCSRPFKMGRKCGVSEFCAKLGLHAHHPRNCLFYLRDKDPQDLQRLLDLSDVKYNCDPPEDDEEDEEEEEKGTRSAACQVMEQKETSDGMVDDYCGKEVEKGFAGLCRLHYVEYLGQLVNKHQVDPIQIFENDDLELVLRRANIRLPPKRYRETDDSYRQKLVNLIHEELPLDKMDGS